MSRTGVGRTTLASPCLNRDLSRAHAYGPAEEALRNGTLLLRDARRARGGGEVLIQPRWTVSFMSGPMTRSEIRMALALARRAATADKPAHCGAVMTSALSS